MPRKARDTKDKPRMGRPPHPYQVKRIYRCVPAHAIPQIDEFLAQVRQEALEQGKTG